MGERALCRQRFGCALPITSDGWTTCDSNLSYHILVTCGGRLFLDAVCALLYLIHKGGFCDYLQFAGSPLVTGRLGSLHGHL